MAPEQPWRGEINRLLYGLMFERTLDDRLVDTAAKGLLHGQVRGSDPQAYQDAIRQALATDATLSDTFETPHGEAEFRDFLRRLAARLDELRPWPPPPYRKVDISEWRGFDHGRPIARIDATPLDVQDRLHVLLDRLPAGDKNAEALILRLRSGETVALLGSTGRRGVTVLQRDAGDPGRTLAAFAEHTGFPADQLTPVG